ncbi:phage distal tail protein [Alkalihalobacterium alkalinitrilicum]|uniref:phage distal tail protein n=1 Tax=Alkalihalobacterium alkalinitrilicum TaxID=427920 RepID=UPI000994D956|nr:phage tail domain-containing protein [Alkalihalobacterium alkalinitrilicum]
MKSEQNFIIKKHNKIIADMHEIGVWIESFHIYSPNISRTKLKVSGNPGSLLVDTHEDERRVSIIMQIEEDNLKKFDGKKHLIYDLIFSEEPFAIVRDLTPDREIYVIQEGDYDIGNITPEDGVFELELTMVDPYLYGPMHQSNFQNDAITLLNEGTAEAYPIIEATAKEDVTFLQVAKEDEYMMIGRQLDAGIQPLDREELVMHDTLTTTTGWTTGTATDIERAISGTMISNGTGFVVQDYGSGTDVYHGPALKKSVPSPLQDFRAEAFVRFPNGSGQVGRIEMVGLDANNAQIFRIGLYDSKPSGNRTKAAARVGTLTNGIRITDTEAVYVDNWTNYIGIYRIERVGNTWSVYFAEVDLATGIHHTTHRRTLNTSEFNQELTQIQLYIAKYTASWGSYDPVNSIFEDLKVYRINEESEIPYIAHEGDVITLDHQTNNILINGESRLDLKDFGASFFALNKGVNHLFTFPEGAYDTKIKWRERFK